MQEYSAAWPAWASNITKWVELTCDAENQSLTIRELANKHSFELTGLSFRNPFNPSLLIMALYMNVVYPFERADWEVLSEEDFARFSKTNMEGKPPQRVFRNALCHGRFTILPGNLIEFHNKDRNGAIQSMTESIEVVGNSLQFALKEPRSRLAMN